MSGSDPRSEGLASLEPAAATTLESLAKDRVAGLHDLSGHWATHAPATAARCARALLDLGHTPATPAAALIVPGRIEVLGKHTDYAGGRSLLAAVERGFTLVSVARPDPVVRVQALDLGEARDFPFTGALQPSAGWANYPMTVARRLARDFPGVGPGADIAMSSDLPLASGMSSSSALVVGTFLSLAIWSGLARDDRFRAEVRTGDDVASYLAAVESGQGFGRLPGDAGVGTHGGSEDHTAILLARTGSLLQYGFMPPALERAVPMPADYCFAIASSGIAAEKTGAMRERYNRAAALVRELREVWAGEHPDASAASLAEIVRSAPDAADRLDRLIRRTSGLRFPEADLRDRLSQFVRESEGIVPSAATALGAGDLDRFGELVDESQGLAGRLLGNQIPETIELARGARDLGAAAASAFGAGYGGSVWALVRESEADEFLHAWRSEYQRSFPAAARHAAFFPSGAGPAALRVG